MAYIVEFSPRAEESFKALPKTVQECLRPAIDVLAEEPSPPGIEKLSGGEDLYPMRVGNYRIIYTIPFRPLYSVIRVSLHPVRTEPMLDWLGKVLMQDVQPNDAWRDHCRGARGGLESLTRLLQHRTRRYDACGTPWELMKQRLGL